MSIIKCMENMLGRSNMAKDVPHVTKGSTSLDFALAEAVNDFRYGESCKTNIVEVEVYPFSSNMVWALLRMAHRSRVVLQK